jgi:hypothetical protein
VKTVLYAKDIARLRGVTVRTARRWLKDLERLHGPQVVGRVGVKVLFTTTEALAVVCPAIADQSRQEARLADVERRLAEVEELMRRRTGRGATKEF